MKAVGIICEYNPFHNGHVYHLNKVKELYPGYIIVLIVSGPFLQRGETSVLTKWDKTELALKYGVDIVIELPFPFAAGSADIFAHGAIELLNHMQVEALVFGSESNDILKLTKLAIIQTKPDYQNAVIKYLKEGMNYPSAMNKGFELYTTDTISSPNDLLGLSYIKEIMKINPSITPISIKRTNAYHDLNLECKITSASSIRNGIKKNIDISPYVPKPVISKIQKTCLIDQYYPFLKYKIMTEFNHLTDYQGIDEKIAARIRNAIYISDNLSDFIQSVKSKKDTYNKINRCLIYLLCNYTKEEAKKHQNISYIRLLGFSTKGRTYLNTIKKELTVPLLTNYSNDKDNLLSLDFRAIQIYSLTFEDSGEVIRQEYQHSVIQFPNKNLT